MLGLLEAILSQTRRALTKILRLDTDYTTGRASNLDNLDVASSTLDSKIDTIDGNVGILKSTYEYQGMDVPAEFKFNRVL